ncbi:MAG: uroporphyrinogen-III synthase [Candidatus Nanopelagicales bacterium]|nr:uroporphyrinogen-III synthase [Candidatus Nanopelagicales bacterium]
MSALLPTTGARAEEPETDGQALAGCTVLVTADRRADQLCSLFERRGARTVHAPVLSLVPCSSDPELIRTTRELLLNPPDVVVVTTAVGFRGWVEAADYAGLGHRLLQMLAGVQIVARGPKAVGAVRSAGLGANWSAPHETSQEVIAHLLEHDLLGRRVAVQHHAGGADGIDTAVRSAGGDAVGLVTYRLGPAADPDAVRESTKDAADGRIDIVCFTSALAVDAWWRVLAESGRAQQFTAHVTAGRVTVAAVGPVCATPLTAHGVPAILPERSRLGSLARAVVQHYADRPALVTSAGALRIRRTSVVLDARVIPLSPTGIELMNLLAAQPGVIVSRSALQAVLPGGPRGDHAVDVAVSRLRETLDAPGLIRTVVKRGYRLAL